MDPHAPDGTARIRTRAKDVERLCSNPASLDKTTKNHLRSIFDRFLAIVREDSSVFESTHYTKGKVFAPIELVAVCCMIAHWGDSRPNGLYRGDICGLRDQIRGVTNLEIRASKEVWAICWKYIEDLDSIRGTIDGSTITKGLLFSDNWANATVAVRPGPPPKRANAPTVPRMVGRPRSPGDDHEYRPTAPARKPGSSQRKKPGRVPKAKDTRPQASGPPSPPKPFAGHRPVWKPGDNDVSTSSSSDDDDDDITPGEGAPTANLAPGPTPEPQGSSARKRAIMELGTGNNTSWDLEAKKAKLMAGRIKQEPGT